MEKKQFFEKAFSRNIGLISHDEALRLKDCSVGIAGLGGVGGSYALTLARMGIGKFIIADFDIYELANFNRQAGANMTTLNKPKIEGIKRMLLEINPHLEITTYSEGLNTKNISEFIQKSDVILDAIDFFSIDAHRMLHQEARKQKKSALFSVPAGHSGTLQIFSPNKMSFDSYYDFTDSDDYFTQICKFAIGMAPKALHTRYLEFDPETLISGRPTSIASACSISTGLICANALLILLDRFDGSHYAPFYTQFDTYTLLGKTGTLFWGNRGPLQRLKLGFMKLKLSQWKTRFQRPTFA
jgi:molybdopterin/thiamine biosynthesis adenylyltransferase